MTICDRLIKLGCILDYGKQKTRKRQTIDVYCLDARGGARTRMMAAMNRREPAGPA